MRRNGKRATKNGQDFAKRRTSPYLPDTRRFISCSAAAATCVLAIAEEELRMRFIGRLIIR